MLSFFGEPCLKAAIVDRVREHQRLDQIAQKIYWDGSKGCAIGCVLHSGEHLAFERQLGLPVFLAYMDEHIFERLPLEEAKGWPLRLIEAVPVGVDLELVFPRFMHWLLTDPKGMRQYANRDMLAIIDTLVAIYARRIEGVPFDIAAAEAAGAEAGAEAGAAWAAWAAGATRAAARAAAEATRAAAEATRAAAEATRAAAEATRAAAEATEAAAWAAAEAAAEAARAEAWAAAEAGAIYRQADYLIALLQSYDTAPGVIVAPCEQVSHFALAKGTP